MLALAGLIAVLATGGTTWYLIARTRRTPGPHLELPGPDPIDLGEGKVGQVLTSSFVIRNRGSAALDFQLQAHCTCTELWPNQDRSRSEWTTLVASQTRPTLREMSGSQQGKRNSKGGLHHGGPHPSDPAREMRVAEDSAAIGFYGRAALF